MKENIEKLKEEFKKIKKKGWIESVEEGTGSIGFTFERQLGKEKENFEIPDYLGIELKVHKRISKTYTTLFNATPDGTYLFEIKRLQTLYGYPDSVLRYCKVLYGTVDAVSIQKLGRHYAYQLEVNYQDEKVYLCIYDGDILIDKTTYWTFSLLKEKLERKVSYLAFIRADQKVIKDKKYFRYFTMEIYHLKSFEIFLKAIEKGYIVVTFTIGVFREGKRKGEIHDHGTAFRIDHKNFRKIFDCC